MTWLLFAFIVLTLFFTFRDKRDFFHPSRIYILLYALLFAVYFLRLSRFQEPWSPTTLMLFWGAVISFIGGGMLVSFYVTRIAPVNHEYLSVSGMSDRLQGQAQTVQWGRFLFITALVFSLFTISFLRSYVQYGVVPMFSSDPNGKRFLYLTGNYFIDIAGGSGPLVMMLCAEVLIIKGTSRLHRIIAAIMLVVSFALYFTLVTRMPLVRTGIYITVLYHYHRKPISLRMISVVAVAVMIFFAFGAIVRIDIGGFAQLAKDLRIHMPGKFMLLINPYAYAVNNVWNMDYGFKKFIDGNFAYNFSFGFEMFRPVFYFLKVENIVQAAYNFDSVYNESVTKVSGLNSVIYIWHLYKDFGIFGMFAVSLVLGVVLHLFYYNTLIAPTPIRMAFYGLIVSMIAFSFMIPLWSFWNIYYEIAILTITHKSLEFI